MNTPQIGTPKPLTKKLAVPAVGRSNRSGRASWGWCWFSFFSPLFWGFLLLSCLLNLKIYLSLSSLKNVILRHILTQCAVDFRSLS